MVHLSLLHRIALTIVLATFTVLQGCALCPRGTERQFTGKCITFESRPSGVRVYHSGFWVGTTPFVYELRTVRDVDPEFIFYQCPYTPTIYQIPRPGDLAFGIEHNFFFVWYGSWFQGKRYYGVRDSSGKLLFVTSKVTVAIPEIGISAGGAELVTQLAEASMASRAHARRVLRVVLQREGCLEADAFLRKPTVAHTLLFDTNAEFRMLVASGLERAHWVPIDSLESAQYQFARQDWSGLSRGGRDAIAVLISGLTDDQRSIADSCSEVLEKIGTQALEQIVVALLNPDTLLRRRCASILGRIGDPRAVEPLASLVRQDPQVRPTAAAALAELGSPAGAVLLELLEHPDLQVRDDVLVPIGTLGRKDEHVVESLVGHLRRSADETDRIYAALALAEVGPPAEIACPALADMFPILTTTAPASKKWGRWEGGGIVDYSVNREVVDASNFYVQAYFYRERELYGHYFEIVEAHGILSSYHPSKSGVSKGTDRSLEATATTRLYAGAFALSRISGMDLGRDQERWREWSRTREAAGTSEPRAALGDAQLQPVGIKELFSGDADTSAYEEKRLPGVSIEPNPFRIGEMGGWAQGIRVQGIPKGAVIEMFDMTKALAVRAIAEEGTWIWHGERLDGTTAREGIYSLRVIKDNVVLHEEFVVIQETTH